MSSDYRATPDPPVALAAIGAAFGLPGPFDVVEYLHGEPGAWRIATGQEREIALKALPAASPDDQLRVTAALEGRALDARLPIVPPFEPVEAAVGFAAQVGAWLVWAHEWIEPAEPPEPVDVHEWVGTAAAQLHALWPALRNRDDDLAHAYGLHDRNDWQGWIDDAYRAKLAWTTDAAEALPAIAEASRLVRAALRDTRLDRCISHRALNPGNVLFGAGGPLLFDFGCAGIEAPWLEIVDAALAFGQAGPVTLDAYREAGGTIGPKTTEALARASGATMNVLALSMWLSLGHRDVGEERQEEATARIPELARNVAAQVESLDATRRLLFGE